jgi:hypothetical protein
MDTRPILLCLAFLLFLPARVFTQDVVDVSLYRAGLYQQEGDAPPQPIPETPFYFLAVMEMSADFINDPDNLLFVREVTLEPPSGSVRAMEFLVFLLGFADYQTFSTAEGLQNTFREGDYTFTFGSLISGDTEYGLFLPDASIPEPARVLNFAEAQNIDSAREFVLRFTPESPAVGNARLVIRQADSFPIFDSGAMLGAQSSISIPARTLQVGASYRGEITFTRLDLMDSSSTPTRSAESVSTTRLPLKTSSVDVEAPQISGITFEFFGDQVLMVLTIQCTPGVPLSVTQAASLTESGGVIRALTPEASPVQVSIPITQISGATAFFRASQ